MGCEYVHVGAFESIWLDIVASESIGLHIVSFHRSSKEATELLPASRSDCGESAQLLDIVTLSIIHIQCNIHAPSALQVQLVRSSI